MNAPKNPVLSQSFTGSDSTQVLIRYSLIVSVAALALYCLTLAPTIGWGDSADLALRMVNRDDPSFANTSRDYVMYRWIGSAFQLLPFGDGGTRANFMTAFFGAISVGLTAFIAGFVTRNRLALIASGISLAVSHTFWFLSVTAEVYTFNAALILGAFASVAIWYRTGGTAPLIAAGLFTGLALAHHATGLVLAATLTPLLLIKWRKLRLLALLVGLASFMLASQSYWFSVFERFDTNFSLLKNLGLLTSNNPFFDVNPAREAVKFAGYATYNFAGLAVFLVIAGLLGTWKARHLELAPPLIWTSMLIFAGITSSLPDKFNIYVLAYPTLAILVGVGLVSLLRRYSPKDFILALLVASLAIAPVASYGVTVWLSGLLNVDIVGARTAPYRDNAKYFLWPPKKGDYGPRRYAEEALAQVGPGSILIADYTLWRPLMYIQQIESVRRDVEIVFVERLLPQGVATYIEKQIHDRQVYLATNTPARYYQLGEIEKQFKIEKDGVVYEILR